MGMFSSITREAVYKSLIVRLEELVEADGTLSKESVDQLRRELTDEYEAAKEGY